MAEALALADKLSGVGLAALLIFVLWLGSTKRWVWGYQLTECEARCAALVAAAERREQEWKDIARPAMRLANESLQVAKESKT
jgi:hypothetical protein